MRKTGIIVASCLLALPFLGCEGRTDKTDAGGVVLTISDFDGLPFAVDVNEDLAINQFVQIESLTIQNIVKDPEGDFSELMDVEMDRYIVTFSRIDGGTQAPPPFTQATFLYVPAGGTAELENAPVLGPAQWTNPPLSFLLFEQGGVDPETGDTSIAVDATIQFFGRTISGDPVATEPASWSMTFFQ